MTIAREITPLDLVEMTAQIAAAHVSNNSVAVGDVGTLITNIHDALKMSAHVEPEPVIKPVRKVSETASIRPDYLVSMIDGSRHKMLKRHIGKHGYTPESYREAFGLKSDYPMTCKNYAAQRADLAKRIGLGTKANRKR